MHGIYTDACADVEPSLRPWPGTSKRRTHKWFESECLKSAVSTDSKSGYIEPVRATVSDSPGPSSFKFGLYSRCQISLTCQELFLTRLPARDGPSQFVTPAIRPGLHRASNDDSMKSCSFGGNENGHVTCTVLMASRKIPHITVMRYKSDKILDRIHFNRCQSTQCHGL